MVDDPYTLVVALNKEVIFFLFLSFIIFTFIS